jgi:hypothetical protein
MLAASKCYTQCAIVPLVAEFPYRVDLLMGVIAFCTQRATWARRITSVIAWRSVIGLVFFGPLRQRAFAYAFGAGVVDTGGESGTVQAALARHRRVSSQ